MIYNLGSINADFFFSVPNLPSPGETLAATNMERDLGGKGTNMSIAAAKAGAQVCHIGAVGQDGLWAVDALRAAGIDARVDVLPDATTGQAVIFRDPGGENAIVTLAGANGALREAEILKSLQGIGPGDVFLFQNETTLGALAAKTAAKAAAHVLYAAAPFSSEAVQSVRAFVDTLVLNSVEMAQLQASLNVTPETLALEKLVVTDGAKGVTLFQKGQKAVTLPAPTVDVVDTTGAGDTLTGYLAAGLSTGRPIQEALENAVCAASLMTTKKGTASAIPSQEDVDAFRLRIR